MTINDYQFQFDYLNLKNVKIDFNPPLDNFYGKVNAKVACIVGKNGVGKSNVIEYIINYNKILFDKFIINYDTQFDKLVAESELIYYASIINDRRHHGSEKFHNLCENNIDQISELNNQIARKQELLYKLWYILDRRPKDIVSEIKVKIDKVQPVVTNEFPRFGEPFEFNNNRKLSEPENDLLFVILILHKMLPFTGGLNALSSFNDLQNVNDIFEWLKSESFLFEIYHSIEDSDLIINSVTDIHAMWRDLIGLVEKYDYKFKEITETQSSEFLKKYIYFVHTELFNIQPSYNITGSDFIFSSGDDSFYSFLGRVMHCLESLASSGKRNFFLLLDEIDIALHPERQLSLFKNLISELDGLIEKYETNDFEFTILFTTHSPLITSDIAHKNIVYLEKDEASKFTTMHEVSHKAFANNIHSIYRDSFYLSDGLIGKFAADFIEHNIIDLLYEKIKKSKSKIANKKVMSENDKEERIYTDRVKNLKPKEKELLMNRINIIGEPIIHSKLMTDLLNSRNFDDSEIKELINLFKSQP